MPSFACTQWILHSAPAASLPTKVAQDAIVCEYCDCRRPHGLWMQYRRSINCTRAHLVDAFCPSLGGLNSRVPQRRARQHEMPRPSVVHSLADREPDRRPPPWRREATQPRPAGHVSLFTRHGRRRQQRERGLLYVPLAFAAQEGYARRAEAVLHQSTVQVARVEGTHEAAAFSSVAFETSAMLARFAVRAHLRRGRGRPTAYVGQDAMRGAIGAAAAGRRSNAFMWSFRGRFGFGREFHPRGPRQHRLSPTTSTCPGQLFAGE